MANFEQENPEFQLPAESTKELFKLLVGQLVAAKPNKYGDAAYKLAGETEVVVGRYDGKYSYTFCEAPIVDQRGVMVTLYKMYELSEDNQIMRTVWDEGITGGHQPPDLGLSAEATASLQADLAVQAAEEVLERAASKHMSGIERFKDFIDPIAQKREAWLADNRERPVTEAELREVVGKMALLFSRRWSQMQFGGFTGDLKLYDLPGSRIASLFRQEDGDFQFAFWNIYSNNEARRPGACYLILSGQIEKEIEVEAAPPEPGAPGEFDWPDKDYAWAPTDFEDMAELVGDMAAIREITREEMLALYPPSDLF